ncbi:MAG: hypothetical protein JW755_03705 [Candidatus Aminicenantes bacterium]|nr:hypothetical protein [Candidatus Aminicenantes bacterium]
MAKNWFNLTSRVLLFTVFTLVFILAGMVACKGGEEEEALEVDTANISEGITITQEGMVEFEGTVKYTGGNFMYIPKVRGFDVYVQGSLDTGDLASLEGKEVRGKGEFDPVNTSVLIVNSLELKGETGDYTPIYTRTEEPVLENYLDLQTRDEYVELTDLQYNDNEGWEGKEKAKVNGKLEQDGDNYKIVLSDKGGRTSGTILVDNISDLAQYYLEKLGIFDSYWFYLNIKETVPWNERRRTRELFHADIIFIGLF